MIKIHQAVINESSIVDYLFHILSLELNTIDNTDKTDWDAVEMEDIDDDQHKGAIKGEASTGRRTIVFVLGGLTYSELRSMHELSRSLGREIIVGSTDMLTPQGFILALKEMKQLDAPSLV